MVIAIGRVRWGGSEMPMVIVQDVLTRTPRKHQRKNATNVTILEASMFVPITMDLVNIKDSY